MLVVTKISLGLSCHHMNICNVLLPSLAPQEVSLAVLPLRTSCLGFAVRLKGASVPESFLCGSVIPMTLRVFSPSLSAISWFRYVETRTVQKFWAKLFHFFGRQCLGNLFNGHPAKGTMAHFASLRHRGKKKRSRYERERHCSGGLCQLTSLVPRYLFC